MPTSTNFWLFKNPNDLFYARNLFWINNNCIALNKTYVFEAKYWYYLEKASK